MHNRADFTTLLQGFMRRAHRTPSELAQLTGLSPNTLKNWIGGTVLRPRFLPDLLKT